MKGRGSETNAGRHHTLTEIQMPGSFLSSVNIWLHLRAGVKQDFVKNTGKSPVDFEAQLH